MNPLEKLHDFVRGPTVDIEHLKAQLTTQTNRAAAAEQQVTALTQRLDMANRLNTDARNKLAQLTKKNAWLEDEMRSQCNIHGMAAEREAKRMTQNQRMHERIAELEAQLSARQAAPDGWRLVPVKVAEEMHVAAVKVLHRSNGVDGLPQRMLDAMLSAAPPPPEREPLKAQEVHGLCESAGYLPGDEAKADFINGLRHGEMAHGIGATNDNP